MTRAYGSSARARKARLEACADFEARREFLVGHVERIIYNRYQVTIVGSVPVQSASVPTKLQFRIEGKSTKRRYAPGRERCNPGGAVETSARARWLHLARTRHSGALRLL